MKKVFRGDNSTVAHMWANKSQSEATNGSNFYFDGDTIYSYGDHFPIAKHITHDGNSAVLFTEETYSNTTRKHISIVKHACSHLYVIYCASPTATHSANFDFWLKSAEAITAKLATAKKPEKYLNELAHINGHVSKYATFFGIIIPDSLQAALAIENKDQYKSYKDNKEAILEAEKKKQAEALKRKHKKEFAKWLSGETDRLYTRNGEDYLRMDLHNENVETTQGIKIQLPIARAFWKSIKDGKLAVGDMLESYTVNEVSDLIKIGCHTFKKDYLIKFGNTHFIN
jgi:hypothetical protein